MRIDSTLRFPRQMTLSATGNDSSVYFMAEEIARQCRRLGIHINFAPDADVNSNPLNPVIGSRAFSDDATSVTNRAMLYMNGLQNNRVLACAKHFPGHGDTDTDSHLALPVIHKNKTQLDSLELIPFRKLIIEGAGSVMVAHIFMPEIDSSQNAAATLSKRVVTGLLKNEMRFSGLVFTDAQTKRQQHRVAEDHVIDDAAEEIPVEDVRRCGRFDERAEAGQRRVRRRDDALERQHVRRRQRHVDAEERRRARRAR